MTDKVKKVLTEYFLITVGLLLTCTAMRTCFLLHSIAPGGVHGITIFLHTAFELPLSASTLVINILMTIATFLFLGRSCGVRTIYAIALMSLLVEIIPSYKLISNPYLSAVTGAVFAAFGIALVIQQNASPGGTTVIAMILKKYAHWKLSWGMIAVDGIVVIAMTCVTKKLETFLTSVIAMALIGFLTGFLTDRMKEKKSLKI